MTSRGWILVVKASKSKSSAEKDAEMLRSKGCEVVNLYQSPAHAIVITKEETK